MVLGAFAAPQPLQAAGTSDSASTALADIERRSGGRLGVAAVNTGTGRSMHYRDRERFAMCSTFKLLAAAAVLSRVDRGLERLDRRIAYTNADLLDYAPITRKNVESGGMTLDALCAAAIEYSDNTAANLLLKTLGGPGAVTRYARSLGDGVTRLDRSEPALNSAIPGDPRDTTTPGAMVDDMRRILLGTALDASSRQRLTVWLVRSRTGATCLRAGFPASWTVGDKTGSGGAVNAAGDSSTRNDVAIAWRPRAAPLVAAVYLTGSPLPAAQRDAILAAAAGRVIASAVR